MDFCVTPNFIQFDLLFVVTARKKCVKLGAASAWSPHRLPLHALLEHASRLPAFSPSQFVRFQLVTIFFDASENIQAPVVPHRRPSLNDVVRLWMQFGQIVNGGIIFLCFSI